METAAIVLLFLMSVVIHEVSHGVTAYFLGDSTAKDAGRLTLNPLRHLDLFWTVLLPLLLFMSTQGRFAIGMAKPVPVNFARLRRPKRDMIWVSLAGPLANILFAVGLSFLWRAFGTFLFLYGVYFNLGLAMFNLIPIPPLDGSKILAGILPWSLAHRIFKWERFGFILIMALYFTGMLSRWVVPGVDGMCKILRVPGFEMDF